MTIHVDSKVGFDESNKAFLALNIPYICLIESEKTFFPIVGKPYYFVSQDCAVLESDKSHTFKVI